MLAEDGPHAPHLAAMPVERKALTEATSRLQLELRAVEARETKLLSAVAQRSVDEFQRDWKAHVAEATAAHVDPFYLPRHEGLIGRLQELRADPAAEELPERERNWIDSILEQDTRRTEAVSHVHAYRAEVRRCRDQLDHLKDLAHTHKSRLEEVPAYDEWHDTAERLLAAGKAIADDRNTYGPCLDHTFMTWHKVHDGIRDLAGALGHPTGSLLHRQPELHLQPITRPVPILDEAREADASYRRLREQWHTHVARAESDGLHPYDLDGHSQLIEAMRALLDRPGLATNAQQALDTLLHDYDHLHRDRQHVHAYLEEAEHALERYQGFKATVQMLSPTGIGVGDIDSHGEWKDSPCPWPDRWRRFSRFMTRRRTMDRPAEYCRAGMAGQLDARCAGECNYASASLRPRSG